MLPRNGVPRFCGSRPRQVTRCFYLSLPPNCSTGNFHDIFKIRADLSGIINGITRPTGQNKGIQYFRLDYEIIILFGTTEFKAQYAWKENVRVEYIFHFPNLIFLLLHSRESKSGKFTVMLGVISQNKIKMPRGPAEILFDTEIEYQT